MPIRFFAILVFCMLYCVCSPGADRLVVSENGRYLTYDDGRPFFYLGDTAWELFHRLGKPEIDVYLGTRSEQGFTVIQAVALAEQDGLNTPNAQGHRPLIDNDPARPDVKPGPDNDYWDLVDYVVDGAETCGMFIGMLPTWGDKWQPGGGKGPCVFTVENARAYGHWLGERYRDKPIIWILGGDRNIYTPVDREIIESMARGLREGDGGTHLITYHPRGPGLSSDYFHDADWLDFNMFQSSHAARDHDNGLFTEHDYALTPPKPTLDGEPRYEALRVGFYNRDAARNLVFDDYDARQAAWWSVMAGACGHTYGNGNIWQMWDVGRPSVLGANIPWHEAIHHPGAFQMSHLRDLFQSRPMLKLVPDNAMVVDGPTRGGAKIRAIRASDGSYAYIYSPRGEQFTVKMGTIKALSVRASWYDPRYGATHEIHVSDNTGMQTFVPPSSGRGQDWVLILDDVDAGFKPPAYRSMSGGFM